MVRLGRSSRARGQSVSTQTVQVLVTEGGPPRQPLSSRRRPLPSSLDLQLGRSLSGLVDPGFALEPGVRDWWLRLDGFWRDRGAYRRRLIRRLVASDSVGEPSVGGD